MGRRALSDDRMLSVELSTIMSRNMYTREPTPVIEELRTAAGHNLDALAEEVGLWVGFYGNAAGVDALVASLMTMSDLDLEPHIQEGKARRAVPHPTIPIAREAYGLRK